MDAYVVISPRAVTADAAAAAVDTILARRAWDVVVRDNDREDNSKEVILPYQVMTQSVAAGTMSRRRRGVHHRRNNNDVEEGGHIIAGTTTTMDTNAAIIAAVD